MTYIAIAFLYDVRHALHRFAILFYYKQMIDD